MEYFQEVEARNAVKFGPDWRAKVPEQGPDLWAAFRPENVKSKVAAEAGLFAFSSASNGGINYAKVDCLGCCGDALCLRK